MRMRYPSILALAAVIALAGAALADTGFVATIDGISESPPNASPGYGNGYFVLNNAGTQLSYNISYVGLVGARTAQHIHKAAAGFNGGIVFGLTGATGSNSGTIIGAQSGLTAAQVADLMAQLWYVNIHTNAFPGGEIRGQLYPDVTPARPTTWGRLKAMYR
ncbi:MAG: CHRD domain-containing protein [Candidatus Eisenbacteria bacterium]|nr:CHRD domain-containing protein [Candidatus Eisenbacteria bacterium]